MTRLLIAHHSTFGTHRRLAGIAAEGARARGADVRLRRVPVVPGAPVPAEPDPTPLVELDDLRWAEGLLCSCPTHFGGPSGSFKAFLDSTSVLWRGNELQHLVVGAMSGSNSWEGGGAATVLSVHRAAMHWGATVVPGHHGPAADTLGPYGVSISRDHPTPWATIARAVDGLVLSVIEVAAALRPAARPDPDPVAPTVAVVADPGLGTTADAVADAVRAAGGDVVRMSPWDAADPDGLAGIDAVALGTTARSGLPDAATVRLVHEWTRDGRHGPVAGLPVTGFVASTGTADGPVSGLLALYAAVMHAGAVVVPAGRGEHRVDGGTGNPYGTSSHGISPAAVRREAGYHSARLVRAATGLRRAPVPT